MRIREERIKKKMSQKELAAAIGVTPSMLSKYESGTVAPSVDKIRRIAAVLDVAVDDLLPSQENLELPSRSLIQQVERQIKELTLRHFEAAGFPLTDDSEKIKPFDLSYARDGKLWVMELFHVIDRGGDIPDLRNRFYYLIGKAAFISGISKLSFVTDLPLDRVKDRLSLPPREFCLPFDLSIIHVDLDNESVDDELELSTRFDGAGLFDLLVEGKAAESAKQYAMWKTSLSKS